MFESIVCLANSRKNSGRCIAGKKITEDGSYADWVRPVSCRVGGEISEDDRRYSDGNFANVGDIIRISMKDRSVHFFQKENYLIDDRYYWEKIGIYNGDFRDLIDEPTSLWINGCSSYNGVNDRVSENSLSGLTSSLYLIEPSDVSIVVAKEYAEKNKVRMKFRYKGVDYKLAVPIRDVESYYLAKGVGEYVIENRVVVTVSLGEKFDGYSYKLVAGLFGDWAV